MQRVKYVEELFARIVVKVSKQQHQTDTRQRTEQGERCMALHLFCYILKLLICSHYQSPITIYQFLKVLLYIGLSVLQSFSPAREIIGVADFGLTGYIITPRCRRSLLSLRPHGPGFANYRKIGAGKIGKKSMKMLRTVSDFSQKPGGCVLTIGNFDGVHIGHREILAAAKKASAQRAAEFVVMTFEPHPLTVLYPDKAHGVLTPFALKEHLLAQSGVDCLLALESTRQLLALSAGDFVERFLVENIRPGIVVEGRSFNFGSGRTGGIGTLQELGAEKGFDVLLVEDRDVKLSSGQTVTVSSTVIRELLQAGSVAEAATALGRAYRLAEKIIPGRGKGKRLGFPTANIRLPGQIIPDQGVYAGFVEVADSFTALFSAKERIPAALSIGTSESLGAGLPLSIEAHLLTQNVGDLADKWLAMDFVERLRGQTQFETESALSAQIAKDCQYAKNILKRE